ncbi:Peptidyl-prolyl cis-trans isomerase CYP18-3 [Acorus gramineus]|uniref:Peptidyl-prolyl cis-trans isomerase CYP18-3 n=1 Tax=Acorus gramineus TaxID=55184 RepID=A0AAV9BSQ9_ACOGR|nr:Peptidyl-prolyl cis-trans isomerase CYP18-3 [Acorus gramineus]
MRHYLQTLHPSTAQILHPPPPNPHTQKISTQPPCLQPNLGLSRREIAIHGLLLSGTLTIAEPFQPSRARADEENSKTGGDCSYGSPTKRAFFDVSVDREPVGRIIIGLYTDDAPVGATRFSELLSGSSGISYRRKEFIKIMPNYIQHAGLRSYGIDAELANKTGKNLIVDELIQEWENANNRCSQTKNLAGRVGIIVRDPSKPPPKLKLVARKGKLEIDEEEVGTNPNGTEFVITTKDSPELDNSTLVVGRVLEGMEVVEKISKVTTVNENTSSPYFRVAKLIGDKRAVVAERGFNRPYSKIVVTNCGLVE